MLTEKIKIKKNGKEARTGSDLLTISSENVPVSSDLETVDLEALSGALCFRFSMGLSSVELLNSFFRPVFSPDFDISSQ